MATRRRRIEDDFRDHAQRIADIYNEGIDRLEEHRRYVNEHGANVPPLQRPDPLAVPEKKRGRRP
jgi:hypothetical protein